MRRRPMLVVGVGSAAALQALTDPDGWMTPPLELTLGGVEQMAPVRFRVTEWWADGQTLDLGGRTLQVIHTPGHSAASMALLDEDTDQLYTGDLLYPGQLLALFEGANMGAYLTSVEGLLDRVGEDTTLLPGHVDLALDPWRFVALGAGDLRDLRDTLRAIRDEGREPDTLLPPTWHVNDRVRLTATFPWNMDWVAPGHP